MTAAVLNLFPLEDEAPPLPVAALFVEPEGVYCDVPGVDPWDEDRDARRYRGPWPVVCHSPCQRWGRFWHGSTRKPHQYKMGDDKGCFAAAIGAVRRWGGVLEHPKDSHAWDKEFFNLAKPKVGQGWIKADDHGGWTCCVDQAHYGHFARKQTWLYAARVDLPELVWKPHPQIIPQWMIDRYGYEKARRIGMVAMVGGKDKTKIRNGTPPGFRDLLISIARTARAVKDEVTNDRLA